MHGWTVIIYSRMYVLNLLILIFIAVLPGSLADGGSVYGSGQIHTISQPDDNSSDAIRQQPTGIPVLCYHNILPARLINEESGQFTVSTEQFDEQMKWLNRNGYAPVSLSQFFHYLAGRPGSVQFSKKPVLITFDDGYKSFYNYARKILKKYSWKAVVFVITDPVDSGERRFLDYGQLRELVREGHEIQSHTHSHNQLANMSLNRQFDELVNSKQILERHLGTKVEWVSYPYGVFNTSSAGQVLLAGYTGAFTVFPGENVPVGGKSPFRHFFLNRFLVTPDYSLNDFAGIMGWKSAVVSRVRPENGSRIKYGESASMVIEKGLDKRNIRLENGIRFTGKNPAVPFLYNPETGVLEYRIHARSPYLVVRLKYKISGIQHVASVLYINFRQNDDSGRIAGSGK